MSKRTQKMRAERLAAALSRLEPRERDVYQLGAVEGFSNDEIASSLGLSLAEVEQRLADALLALDRELSASDRRWWRF